MLIFRGLGSETANGRDGEWANGRRGRDGEWARRRMGETAMGRGGAKISARGRRSNQILRIRAGFEPRRAYSFSAQRSPIRPLAVSPIRRLASPPFIRIARLIDSVGRIDDVFGGTTELNESVGQKRFAIDPDPGFVGVKHYGDHFVAASQG